MNYKGIFFDFDYTLGDSTAAIVQGFQAGFTALGKPAPTREQVRPTIGMTLTEAYRLLTGDGDPAHADAFYHQFQLAVGELAGETGSRLMVEESRLFPGAAELLAALRERGIAVAVVSTKLGVTIRRILERNLTCLPDVIVGGEDVKHNKPSPEGMRVALDALKLRPEEVLFCGDTVIDAKTAQNAGTDFAAVLNGTTPGAAFAEYPCVHIAPDLPQLRRWLGC